MKHQLTRNKFFLVCVLLLVGLIFPYLIKLAKAPLLDQVVGPYYETGLVATIKVRVTAYYDDMNPQSYTLDGTDGVADTVNLPDKATYFSWNLTSSGNQSRTIWLSSVHETYNVFMPNLADPYYLYSFTVTDFVGLSNAYLETIVSINSTSQIVERLPLSSVNNLEFWFSWQHYYALRIISDQGTINYGDFQARSETNQNIVLTTDMIPVPTEGLNITVNALRINATWVQANYTDSQTETNWLTVTIKHKVGYTLVQDYTTNNTGDTQQINWYSASASLDYLVYLVASRDSGELSWSFSTPFYEPDTNPWAEPLTILGDSLPFPIANIVGFTIVMFFFGMTTYEDRHLGLVVGILVAGFLTYIHWLAIPVTFIALALCLAVFFILSEAKKHERLTGGET